MDRRSTVFVLSLVGAMIAGMFASNTLKQAQKTREGTKLEQGIKQAREAQEVLKLEQAIKQAQEVSKLEQQGFTALRQFEFQELEALLTAMEAGQRLKELVKDGRQLEKYPASSPILALQTILDNIHERTQLTNNQSNFNSASFSADGSRIVTTTSYDTAQVWDTSGKLLAQLKGHTKSVESASFSPDSKRIVTASNDGTAKVWDNSGKLLAELKGDTKSVKSANFSPNSTRIVTTSEDGTAKVWDNSGKLLAELKGDTKSVKSANFSPDGTRIVTTSEDGTAKVWDTSGKLLAELKEIGEDTNYFFSASFSPDGQRIVTAGGKVKVWDTSGKLLIRLYSGYPTDASFSPDGKLIITFSRSDDTVRIWDSSGNRKAELKGHWGGVSSVSFSSDGQFILVAPYQSDSTAKVWDISGKFLTSLNQRKIKSASFSPKGHRIVTVSSSVGHFESDVVNIWDLSDRRFGNIKLREGNTNDFVVGSPDGKHILASRYNSSTISDRTVWVWDLSGRLIAELKTQADFYPSFSPNGQHILTSGTRKDETIRMWNLSGKLVATFKGWRGSFSPDGKRIITIFKDKPIVQIWDLSGRLLTELKGHQRVIIDASFSPDSQRIITVSVDNTARVWDLSGKILAEIKRFDSDSRKLHLLWQAGLGIPTPTFSSNGQHILSVTADDTIRLWNLSGKLLTEKKYQDDIRQASFSPDGQRILLIPFAGGTAHVWDLSGRQLAELKGHQDSISQASFSPDGQRILSITFDNTVRLWDLSGRLLAELKMPDSQKTFTNNFQRLRTAFFTQDSKQIVAVFDDNTIRVWQVGGLDELLVRGCDWLKDYLATHPEARERLKMCQ